MLIFSTVKEYFSYLKAIIFIKFINFRLSFLPDYMILQTLVHLTSIWTIVFVLNY
jgi:hypothetical protein